MPQGIIIVGLGPGDPGLLTCEARDVLQATPEIYLRTRQHPTVEGLPTSVVLHSFDDVYEHADTIDAVYAEIATRVVELGQRVQGVVYAVPGHPLVGESSVQRILAMAELQQMPVRIVEGLSFLEPVLRHLHLDPVKGLQIADATMLAARHYPEFNPDLPLLLSQLYHRDEAVDVKGALMMLYPDDHPVTLVRAAGTSAITLREIPLYELDHDDGIDHLTTLYVPPLTQPGSVQAFQELVAHLRAPNGCPWDREQTHLSLRPYLLEETYEVLQALDSEDQLSLQEELGDLLLQILMHVQVSIEDEEFKMTDVISHIVSKLKRRHPHVFGQVQVSGAEEVLVNWERIKSEERNHAHKPDGALNGVPAAMPALTRAQSLQQRAARIGFDWEDVAGAWAKLEDELAALREAEMDEQQTAELGEVLFALVDLARWLHVDAESALRQSMQRFAQRFEDVERECSARGQSPTNLSPAEWQALWQQAKKRNG